MEDAVEKLWRLLQLGLLGVFGGAAAYVYTLSTRGTPFRWVGFAANLFLAFFVGCMAGDWIPSGGAMTDYKDGLVMAVGFCAYPILGLVEKALPGWIANRMFR